MNEFALPFAQHPNRASPFSPGLQDEMSLAMPWGSKVLPRLGMKNVSGNNEALLKGAEGSWDSYAVDNFFLFCFFHGFPG